MMNEENIRAILETNFAGYKDEIIDVAVKKIIGLLDKHDEEVIKDIVESIWGEPCENCNFCSEHEQGDTLYEMSSWDGGIGYDYVRPIKYCPMCGRKLKEEEE